MMDKLFLLYLSLSLSGTLLALLLLLLRPLLRGWTSRGWQYYIYLVVVLRLLVPLSPPDSFIGTLFSQAGRYVTAREPIRAATEAVVEFAPEDTDLPTLTGIQAMNPRPDNPAPAPHSPAGISWNRLLNWGGVLWCAVATALFTGKMVGYLRFTAVLRRFCLPVESGEIHSLYKQAGTAMHLRRLPPLCRNALAATPMVVGTFRPVIALPPKDTIAEGLSSVFIHELTHYRRRDILYKWLVQLVVCLHWFNPVIYWMAGEVEKLCELSCDEAVVRRIGTADRLLYGDTLLASITPGRRRQASLLPIPFSGDKALIKERLLLIRHYKQRRPLAICLSAVLAVLLFCGAAFTGSYAGNSLSQAAPAPFTGTEADTVLFQQVSPTPPGIVPVDGYRRISRTLDSTDVRNIKVEADMCTLYLEPVSGEEFQVTFSYPEALAYNYENYFDLLVEQDGSTAVVATGYDDIHGFDPIEGISPDEIPAASLLVVGVPDRAYQQVNVQASYLGNEIFPFQIASKSLHMDIRVCNRMIFSSSHTFDRLEINLYEGALNLQLPELGKQTDIHIFNGMLGVDLPQNPQNYAFTLHNREPSGYSLPASWAPLVDGETVRHSEGMPLNTLNVTSSGHSTFAIKAGNTPSVQSTAADNSASGYDPNRTTPIVHRDLSDTYAVSRSDFSHSGNYFKSFRIDVVDNNGFDHQALVYLCEGTEEFTAPFRSYLQQLKGAYPDDYGYITGFTDPADHDTARTYRQLEIPVEFIAVEEVTFTDRDGVSRRAVVVAEGGTEHSKERSEALFDELYDAYMQ